MELQVDSSFTLSRLGRPFGEGFSLENIGNGVDKNYKEILNNVHIHCVIALTLFVCLFGCLFLCYMIFNPLLTASQTRREETVGGLGGAMV